MSIISVVFNQNAIKNIGSLSIFQYKVENYTKIVFLKGILLLLNVRNNFALLNGSCWLPKFDKGNNLYNYQDYDGARDIIAIIFFEIYMLNLPNISEKFLPFSDVLYTRFM